MEQPQPLRLTFSADRICEVWFNPLSEVPRLMAECGLQSGPCLIVTDEHVAALHLTGLVDALRSDGRQARVRLLPPGESSKSLRTLDEVYDWALHVDERGGLMRGTPLLALGGGVVGDVAGFAAATLLRGLPLVHLPTSLLAQVDSAIGGKTGINHASGKNLIGAVYQPRLIVADPNTLVTLPGREWFSGLAEVVKAGLVADESFFAWLEANWDEVSHRSSPVVNEMVRRAAAIKAQIVEADEHEANRREILNFGHTFAHAIERVTNHLVFTHGEAVALGMRAALHVSQSLAPNLDRTRADRMVELLPLPAPLDVPLADLMDAMQVDKKRTEAGLRFVVLDEIGSAKVVSDVPSDLITAAWESVLDFKASR